MSSMIRDTWDLANLYYKSIDDPKITEDIKKADKLVSNFANKYKNNEKFTKNEKDLFHVLEESEKISDSLISKPYLYLHYLQCLNSSDENVIAKMNLVSQEYSRITNKLIFLDVRLSKVSTPLQKKFLKSPRLKKYKYLLKRAFISGKYTLSEPEEKILSLKSITSRKMWTDLTDRLENKILIEHLGQKIPISKAFGIISELKTQKDRLELHEKCMRELEKISDVAEAELNAVVTDKKIGDELRGYKEPIDATIIGYQNDKKSVINLVDTVTKNFSVSQRFYRVKAKMLGLKRLNYSDRAAGVGTNDEKISYEESFERLMTVFEELDPRFSSILKQMAENGQIDAHPKHGKQGGAFCSHEVNQPTMVLLNHVPSFKSHMTFAHEMGHAIHSEFSKEQPNMYQSYSTSTAEVASTLFESFVFYDALKKLNDKEKIVALHDRIQDDIQTIFRQIACFNFELEIHKTIREKGNMSKAELRDGLNKHMKSYIGDILDIKPEDGYFFVSWAHLRYMFYVYSYAFGQLASKALYKKYSKDKRYIDKIKVFLSAGGSKTPEDIFKSAGIDIKNPLFWKKGIESINDDIAELERLVEKTAKKS